LHKMAVLHSEIICLPSIIKIFRMQITIAE
jgi:hypothetical protein